MASNSILLIIISQVQNLMEVGNKLRAKLLIASGGEDTLSSRAGDQVGDNFKGKVLDNI